MTELTEQDKQRIEDFITKLGWDEKGTAEFNDMMKVAEYATGYEREQQYTPGLFIYKERYIQQKQQIEKLEVERTKLRNKVIEEVITVIESEPWNPGGYQFRKLLYKKLNSLKTK